MNLYQVTEQEIKNFLNVDVKQMLANPSSIERELKQNYNRLVNFVISRNAFLKQTGSSSMSYAAEKYLNGKTTPLEALISRLDTDFKIQQWKMIQALQLVYELENGAQAFTGGKLQRINPEAYEIMLNTLDLIWRTEWMKG